MPSKNPPKKTNKTTKKVADIRPPEPGSSSRPIIVTNHSLARDPMLSGTSDTGEGASTDSPLATHRKTIMPLADSTESDTAVENSESDASPTSAAPTASELVEKLEARKKTSNQSDETVPDTDNDPDEAPAPDSDPGKSVANGDEISKDSEPAADAVNTDTDKSGEAEIKSDSDSGETDNNDSDKPPAKSKSDLEAEAKRQAELAELTASGKYFLPINQVQKRHDRRLLIGLVIVLLIIILVDLLYDSGVLKSSGFTFHTHFFHH